jgi:hypothetical protein
VMVPRSAAGCKGGCCDGNRAACRRLSDARRGTAWREARRDVRSHAPE